MQVALAYERVNIFAMLKKEFKKAHFKRRSTWFIPMSFVTNLKPYITIHNDVLDNNLLKFGLIILEFVGKIRAGRKNIVRILKVLLF